MPVPPAMQVHPARVTTRRSFLRTTAEVGSLAALAPTALACGPDAAGGAVTLRYATALTADDPSAVAMKRFKKHVEQSSDRAITIETFDSGALGDLDELVDQLMAGALSITAAGGSYFQTIVPQALLVTLPYLVSSSDEMLDLVDGSVGDELAQHFEPHGMKVLGWQAQGCRHVFNNLRPIKSTADMSGIKIRTQTNPAQADFFAKAGMNPVAIDYGEIYSAMQQGVIDGFENPASSAVSQNFHEVSRYMSLTHHACEVQIEVMSKTQWDELSKKHRRIIQEAVDKETAYQRELTRKNERDALEAIKNKGVVVNEVPADTTEELATIAESVYQKYKKQIGAELLNSAMHNAS